LNNALLEKNIHLKILSNVVEANKLCQVTNMPTYDYDCTECGHAFEEFQSITAPALEVCPQCGGKVQRRINGGAGLIFKGSGFYLTDYKRAPAGDAKAGNGKSGNAAAKKDGEAAAQKEGGDAAKKEGSDAAKKEGSEKGTSEKPEKEKSTTE
jgi:putative FmdB family regulatory protein